MSDTQHPPIPVEPKSLTIAEVKSVQSKAYEIGCNVKTTMTAAQVAALHSAFTTIRLILKF